MENQEILHAQMRDENGLPYQRKCAIAYIDILGIKQKIIDGSDWAFIWTWLQNSSIASMWKNDERIKIKIFSDNILICEEIDENNSSVAVTDVLNVVNSILMSLFRVGSLFMRGAVVVDQLHISDNIVYGLGLVKAYDIESHQAIYPRIIIDQSTLDILNSNHPYIAKDKDGLYFYDFLQKRISQVDSRLQHELKTLKFNIIQNAVNNINDEKIASKMNWMINYFNARCQYNELHYFITKEEVDSFTRRSASSL